MTWSLIMWTVHNVNTYQYFFKIFVLDNVIMQCYNAEGVNFVPKKPYKMHTLMLLWEMINVIK